MGLGCNHDPKWEDQADDGTVYCLYCRCLAAEKRIAELEAKIDEMRSNLRVFAAYFARIISEKAKLERTIERLREAAKEEGASDGE